MDINDVIASPQVFPLYIVNYQIILYFIQIYRNGSKQEKASESDLTLGVGQLRGMDAIKEILTKGEISLTAAERREKVEQKRKEILHFINMYYVDPSNNLPHPIPRLETAMDSFRVCNFLLFFSSLLSYLALRNPNFV